MKSARLVIFRFILATVLISMIVLTSNIIFIYFWGVQDNSDRIKPNQMVQMTAENLIKKENHYFLSANIEEELKSKNVWGMLLNHTGEIVWSQSLPSDLPTNYTLTDVAKFSRYFLNDYPVFVWEHEDGLVVVGYPKDSYGKYFESYKSEWIINLPFIIVLFLCINISLALLLSILFGASMFQAIKPLVAALRDLSDQKPVSLKEKGILSGVAKSINQASALLERNNIMLKKREKARLNWIAGISHDIRTPLSLIIGYSDELAQCQSLSIQQRKTAAIILNQGEKIKELVSDLNLVSKLEYDMQPLNKQAFRLSALTKEVLADFINLDLNIDKYKLDFLCDKEEQTVVLADRQLLKRAIYNLILNSVRHNPNGCRILAGILKTQNGLTLRIADDGVGYPENNLKELTELPYTNKDIKKEHGLGIPMVARIISAHQGSFQMKSNPGKGFECLIHLPT